MRKRLQRKCHQKQSQAGNEVEKVVMKSENQGVYDYVSRMYETVLERNDDAVGIADWYVRLMGGTCNGADVAYGFFFSPEYVPKAKTDDEYVRNLYKALFDRGADETGCNVWMEQLQGGVPRINVLKGFVDSGEFERLCGGYGIAQGTIDMEENGEVIYYSDQFVRRMYQEALKREADLKGLESWKSKLISKEASGAEVAYGFLFSNECSGQNLNNAGFVDLLYQSLFGREADEKGRNIWINQLNNGMKREYVFADFVNSKEFEVLCNKYGIEKGKWSRRKLDPDKPMVALTFNDGPSIYTPRILNCLEEYGQAATFFVVGSNAARYGGYIKRAYDLGCEIGNHTYNHPDLTYLSSWAISSEINQTNQYIRQAIGIDGTITRTPGGSYNSTVCSAIPTPIIMWSIDTLDWKTRDTYSTVNTVLNNVQDGDIVLMHDMHSTTIAAAEILISELARRGYQLVTVGELAEYRGNGMEAGRVYYSF